MRFLIAAITAIMLASCGSSGSKGGGGGSSSTAIPTNLTNNYGKVELFKNTIGYKANHSSTYEEYAGPPDVPSGISTYTGKLIWVSVDGSQGGEGTFNARVDWNDTEGHFNAEIQSTATTENTKYNGIQFSFNTTTGQLRRNSSSLKDNELSGQGLDNDGNYYNFNLATVRSIIDPNFNVELAIEGRFVGNRAQGVIGDFVVTTNNQLLMKDNVGGFIGEHQ